MPIFDWLKILHLAAFVVGLGAAASKFVLVASQRRHADAKRVQLSEELALLLTKKLESPALLIAWLLGLALTMVKGTYWTMGWLHAKMTVTLLMLGLSHMSAASLRKIARLRSEAAAVDKLEAAKSRLTAYGIILAALALATFFLVIFQPF